MDSVKKYIGMAAVALAVAGFYSCSDELAQPPFSIPEENGLIGDGSWEKPLQCWQANEGTTVDGRTSNWVTGYIVGWVDTSVGNTMKPESFRIGVPCNVNTNMVIAQYPYDELKWDSLQYTWENCVTVQLPSGGVRDALNLQSNPDNYNKQVSLRGTTGSKYCGVYGVRSVGDYNWGPEGKYEEPIAPIDDTYYCNFDASGDINYYLERGWRLYNTQGGLSGWYIKMNNGEQFATVSAYLGTETGGPYENWIVTPGFEIEKLKEKTVSFLTQAGYTSEDSSLEVYVMEEYQSPKAAKMTRLECVVAQAPASGFSAWTDSGLLDLSQFSGKIYIGFRYYASAGGQGYSTEFHLDNVNIGGAEVPVDPNAPVIEPVKDVTYKLATEVKDGRKYAFVHDSQVAIPIQEGFSYGYLNGTPFEFVTPDSFVSSNMNAVTFIKEDDGYLLRDYYGRYFFLDNVVSHTSINVSSAKPTTNYLWKVEYRNGRFNIQNIGRGNYIEWSDYYKNFTTVAEDAYANGGPALYEMTE